MANGQLPATIAETDWRLVQGPDDSAALGVQLIREVIDLDATVANSLKATLGATLTLTNPKADGVTHATVATPSTAITTYYLSDLKDIKQSTGPYEGSVTIQEVLTRVKTIAVEADLPAAPVIQRGKEVLDAFALQTGTEDLLAYKWLYLNPVNAAVIHAMTVTAPAGYTEIDRKTNIEERGDRTCTLNILYKKRTWNAWSNGTPDRTIIENSGRDNERRTRYWYGIESSDAATALTAVKSDAGASAVADFHVLLGDVEDNKDGSVTVRQIVVGLITEVANVTANLAGGATLDPFALVSGTALTLRSEYGNLSEIELGALSEATPDTYTFIRSDSRIQDSGLYTKIFEYEKRTWTEWTGGAANRTTYENYGREGEVLTEYWYGIQKADSATALAAVQVASGSYRILTSDFVDNKDGSITVIRRQVAEIVDSAGTEANLTGGATLDPFALVSGTADTFRSVYRNKLDSELPLTESAPTGYTLIQSRSDIDDNGLFTKTFEYAKNTWTAWTNAAADRTVYENYGRDNERRTRFWYGIRKADIELAIAAVRADNAGVHVDGFHVVLGEADDNKDGSLTVRQVIVALVTEVAQVTGRLAGIIALDPFAFASGDSETLRSEYANYDESELAAISEAAPDGYTFVRSSTQIQGNGLYSKTFEYEKRTWLAWGHDAYATDKVDEGNSGNEGERLTKYWYGIQKSDKTTVLTDLANETSPIAVESGYHITDVSISDNKDGSLTAVRTEIKKISQAANAASPPMNATASFDPHALRSAAVATIRSVYANLSETESNAQTDTLPAGYVLRSSNADLQGNGLYTKTFFYEAPVWRAWNSATAPDKVVTANSGRDGERRSKFWYGIRKADITTAEDAVKDGSGVAADANFYILSGEASDNKDGSVTVVQVEVKQVADIANSDATLAGVKTVDPHGITSGTILTLTSEYSNYSAADLLTASAAETTPATYTLIRADSDIDEGSGLYRKRFYYEKPTAWTAWGGAPDLIDYYDVGSKAGAALGGDKNGQIKTWLGIRIADLAAAMADIRDGSGTGVPDAGYIILRAVNRDNHDGSVTLQQTIEKQVTDRDLDGKTVINPLGLYPGVIDELQTIYDSYTIADIGSISETAPASPWVLQGFDTPPLGNGLYRRVYTYVKATWPNTTPDPVVTAEMGMTSERNEARHQIQTYFGVPVAQAAANVQTLATSDDATKPVESISFSERGNGEAVITRTRKYANDASSSSDFLVAELGFSYRTSLWTSLHLYWPALTPAEADALIAILVGTGGVPDPFPFAMYGITGDFHLSAIRRTVDKITGLVRVDFYADNDLVLGLIDDGEITILSQTIEFIGNQQYRVTLGRKVTSTRADAVTWAGAGTVPAGGRGQNSPALLGGSIKWDDASKRYVALKETWTSGNTYSETP